MLTLRENKCMQEHRIFRLELPVKISEPTAKGINNAGFLKAQLKLVLIYIKKVFYSLKNSELNNRLKIFNLTVVNHSLDRFNLIFKKNIYRSCNRYYCALHIIIN